MTRADFEDRTLNQQTISTGNKNLLIFEFQFMVNATDKFIHPIVWYEFLTAQK